MSGVTYAWMVIVLSKYVNWNRVDPRQWMVSEFAIVMRRVSAKWCRVVGVAFSKEKGLQPESGKVARVIGDSGCEDGQM